MQDSLVEEMPLDFVRIEKPVLKVRELRRSCRSNPSRDRRDMLLSLGPGGSMRNWSSSSIAFCWGKL